MGGGDERDKEMGAIGQFTVQGGEKGALERGKITEARRRGKALSLQTARSPSTLPHPPSAMAEERGREARKEAEAAVTLETEPGGPLSSRTVIRAPQRNPVQKKKKNQWGKAPAIEAEDLNLVHRIHVVGKKELPRVIL